MMSKSIKIFLLTIGFLLPAFSLADNINSEVSIDKDGNVKMSGVKIVQNAGKTFFARLYWGDSYIRFLVKTADKTAFYRSTGEKTSYEEVREGDLVTLEGTLESGGTNLVVIPTVFKDESIKKKQTEFSGAISATFNGNITLTTKGGKKITLSPTSTSTILRGVRPITSDKIVVGDKVLKALGEFDYDTNVLTASEINVYVDKKIFEPQTYVGEAADLPSSSTTPFFVNVYISGKLYRVNATPSTSILKKNREKADVNRFMRGDQLRVYGKRLDSDENIIDAEIIRNTSL